MKVILRVIVISGVIRKELSASSSTILKSDNININELDTKFIILHYIVRNDKYNLLFKAEYLLKKKKDFNIYWQRKKWLTVQQTTYNRNAYTVLICKIILKENDRALLTIMSLELVSIDLSLKINKPKYTTVWYTYCVKAFDCALLTISKDRSFFKTHDWNIQNINTHWWECSSVFHMDLFLGTMN